MYNVLLIDDEPIIRDGMKHVIDWGKYGFTICGDSENGQEGLHLIRTLEPDLVFVDIRMPGMSGIELVEQAKKEGFEGKFVILSGYSSFSYAQELIKLRIHSYLLKPIDEEELVEILIEIKQIIDEERMIYSELTAYYDLTEEKAWRAVIDGRIDDWQHSVYVKNQRGPFRLAGIKFRENVKRLKIEEGLFKANQPNVKVILKDQIIYRLYLDFKLKEIEEDLQAILSNFQTEVDPYACACLSEEFDELEETMKAIEQINDTQDRAFSFSNKQIFQFPIQRSETNRDPLNFEAFGAKVIQALEFKDRILLTEQGEKMIDYFQKSALEKARVQIEVTELVLSVARMIKSQYPDIPMLSKNEWLDQIYHQYNLRELVDYLIEEWWSLSKEIKGFATSGEEDSMEKIINYIDQYYAQDLSLKVLADLFNYNSSYLGKKFKKHTNKYFHEYLEQVRIEKAKFLLANSQEKVYVISELVGYSNMDYFYKKFKSYVGKSPKEYQKYLQEQEVQN